MVIIVQNPVGVVFLIVCRCWIVWSYQILNLLGCGYPVDICYTICYGIISHLTYVLFDCRMMGSLGATITKPKTQYNWVGKPNCTEELHHPFLR